MSTPAGVPLPSPVEALGLILRQVQLQGREGAGRLLDEYRDRGSLHVQLDGDDEAFARIEIVVNGTNKPHWWPDA